MCFNLKLAGLYFKLLPIGKMYYGLHAFCFSAVPRVGTGGKYPLHHHRGCTHCSKNGKHLSLPPPARSWMNLGFASAWSLNGDEWVWQLAHVPYMPAPIHHVGLWRIFPSPRAPGDWTQRTLPVIYRIMWCLQVFHCSIKDDKSCHHFTFCARGALSGSANRRVTPLCRTAFIDFSPVTSRVYKSSAPQPVFLNWLPVILWGPWWAPSALQVFAYVCV